jgi:1-acyl-sn-glycerol-3-phosphate acyltransferase
MIFLFIAYPVLLLISIISGKKEKLFQNVIHLSMKSFIKVIDIVVPGTKIEFKNYDEMKNIKSSIIISNHISYLDGLLIFSANKNIVVVVKASFFKVPVMGWILYFSGAIPSEENVNDLTIRRVLNIGKILESGSNILVFPEGTRSKTGQLGLFKAGAFKLAKRYNSPIEMIQIKNAEKTFQNGKFKVGNNVIEVRKIGTLESGKSYIKLKEEAEKTYSKNR